MPHNDGSLLERLLGEEQKPEAVKGGFGNAPDVIGARVERIRNAVQERRDAPTTLLGCAVGFGILSGLVAYVYSGYFEGMLWVVWEVNQD